MACDIVIPVRAGDYNDELRWTLRCLQTNYPHYGRIWIVGHKPNWLTNVEFIPGNPSRHLHANIYLNLLAAATHPDVPAQFLIFNDDFFVTEPINDIPIGYRCTLREHLAIRGARRGAAWWRDSLRTTMICLQTAGFDDPISYELHIPLPVRKDLLAVTLTRFAAVEPQNPPQWRSLYGNLHRIGGRKIIDGKAYVMGAINTPFHSTDDNLWRQYSRQFAARWPTPSRYEKDD